MEIVAEREKLVRAEERLASVGAGLWAGGGRSVRLVAGGGQN